MRKRIGLGIVCLLLVAVIGGLAVAKDDEDELTFDTAKLFIEFNDTDQDVGIQVMLDGEPWEKVTLFDPKGKKILNIKGKDAIRTQGVSELFFESAEPSLDDVSLATFLKRFPAGEYEFEGKTIDGDEIEGEAILTHVIPAGPVIVSPVSDDDEAPEMDVDDAEIEWKAVTETIGGSSDITITGYQVIVTQEDPHRSLLADMPATATSMTIPAEFLTAGAEYEFEVLAIEESGNQTITAGEFETSE